MKPLPSLIPVALLLAPWVWGPAAGRQAPGMLLRSRCSAAGCHAAPGACESSQEYQKVKPGSEFPWISAYVPIRSCHTVLKDKYGEFSPPAYHGDSAINFWCNWTIWAGSRKHIIIYIQGFITKESCNNNEDKILFEGVASLVENSVIYACWKKEMHVFATFAQAVHVVLLNRYLPNCSSTQLKAKYYIFQDQEGESFSKDDMISETPAPKLPKQDSIFQSGSTENLRDVVDFATTYSTMSLGKATVLSGELMQGREITLGTTVGSPMELVLCKHPGAALLETKAPCMLGSELLAGLRCCKEARDRGTLESTIPTAAQDTWGRSISLSGDMHRLSSVLLETPLLGALQAAEHFLQPAGVGLEKSQSLLHPTLRPKDLDDLQFTIKPTHTSCLELAADLRPLSPGRRESKGSADTATYQGLGTTGVEKDQSHPWLSIPADGAVSSDADGLAKGLMPSLSSPYEVVNRDHSNLPPERIQRCQSGFTDISTTQSDLGTTRLQNMKLMDVSSPEHFRGVVGCNTIFSSRTPWDMGPVDFSSTDFTPEAPLPLEVEPVSGVVFSPPAALDLEPISLSQRAGISSVGTTSGGQEVVSPSPAHHPSVTSEQGTDESSGCLGLRMQKPVLGEVGSQQGEASVPVGSPVVGSYPASVTSPKPSVGLPQPEDHVSSDSGVAPASLLCMSGARRREYVVPVQHQGTAASNKLVSAPILSGFKLQKTTEALQGEEKNATSSITLAHPSLPVASWGETVPRDQKPQEISDDPVSRSAQTPGGQQRKHAELGPPWTVEYFPVRSCHVVFRNGSGMFFLPLHTDFKTNIWCNWTILAGSQKHIVIYVQGFQGSDGCGKNQDKIIFQGVLSSVETKAVYACHNRGTLIFATEATAVHVLFLSGGGSLSREYGRFKGRYYVFRDSETLGASNDTIAPQEAVQEVSKKESRRMVVTKGLLPMLRASPSPSGALAGGRIQPELVSSDEEDQHPPSPMEDAQTGANLSKLDLNECDQLQDEIKLERSLKHDSSEGRQTEDDVLLEPPPAGQDTEQEVELSALKIAKGDVELMSALVTVAPCCSEDVPSSEVSSSSIGVSAESSHRDWTRDSRPKVAAAAHCTQAPMLEEPQLRTSTKSSPLYPSPGLTTGQMAFPGERNEELFDLVFALASLENNTALKSQHHPGDVLFEVTVEIKPKDWILHGGSELQKGCLESVKNHIQENLKLSANRVNEIEFKEIKRTSDANLLLTFWLQLKPEERNVSLLLCSQLEKLLGTPVGVKKLQLVSLFVEDVNECSAGLSLCGEEAECFNCVGTYLCRCKKGYEDHSLTKSGTLCIRAPRSGINIFLHHVDILVGVAIMAALATLVAAGIMCRVHCWGRHPRRNLSPEEPLRVTEESAMELHDLGECLRLDPFQLKLRARAPEWPWGARAHPSQAYQVFLEQSP